MTFWQRSRSRRKLHIAVLFTALAGLLASMATMVAVDDVAAAGPAYSGPETAATGPAYFGPAPNVFPYCENPIYFDPLPENVTPNGRIDPGFSTSITTDEVTLTYTLNAEGSPDTQYPGFFPGGGEGSPGDQPKGVEMAFGDDATMTLSEPLFYTQWVFTDVDRENEGFFVSPDWADPAQPGQVGVFGGDEFFSFDVANTTTVSFNDTNTVGEDSEALAGRVQVDLLGAVDGINVLRDVGSGQSGFAAGGGCAPIGAAKEVTSGPTWNGTGFDVTYTISIRNNLPSTTTLAADVANALANAASGDTTGTPVGIDVTSVFLEDVLTDAAFSNIAVASLTNTSGNLTVNAAYDGVADSQLLEAGQTIPPEAEEEFVLELVYTADDLGPLGATCANSYELLNQATVGGTATGVDVEDLSDEGVDPDPGNGNGGGGNDDPTIVVFDCPPLVLDPVLAIVKTVVAAGTPCPAFGAGVVGDGPALVVEDGDTVTYCIAVANTGAGDATNVVVSDPMAPAGFDGTIGDLAANTDDNSLSFDLVVDGTTPVQNTAQVDGDGPDGPLDPATDTALIELDIPLVPVLEIVKTVVAAGTPCPAFDAGEVGDGTPLVVDAGDTVTYCIAVANTGAGDATNVVVSDPMAPAGFDGTIGDLPANTSDNSLSFDLVVDGGTPPQNTAQVDGDGPDGPLDPVTDTALISVTLPDPILEVLKTVVLAGEACPTFDAAVLGDGDALEVRPGDTVTYCIAVANTGPGDATNVVVSDPMAPAGFDGTIGDLASNTSDNSLSFDLVVDTATPPQNTAQVDGDGPGGPLDPVTDTALIEVIPFVPDFEIVKSVIAGPGGACPGYDAANAGDGTPLDVTISDVVTYCISVLNTGETELTDVTVTDALAPASFTGVIGTIAIGDEGTTSFDLVVASDTPLQNVASATVVDPDGNTLDPKTDTAVIDIAPPEPAILLTKTVIEMGGDCSQALQGVDELVVGMVGDLIVWCFVVTNTGNVPLTAVTFNDGPAGLAGVDILAEYGGGAPVLGVGESISFELPSTIPDEGLDNVADVTGQASDPDGTALIGIDPVVDDDDAAIGEVDLDLSKTVVDGPNGDCASAVELLEINQGEPVTYCFTVTNTGSVNMLVVEVIDDTLNAIIPIPAAEQIIAPGDSVTVSLDAIATADLVNTANSPGIPVDDAGNPIPGAPTVDPQDPAEIDTLLADIAVVKSVNTPTEVTNGIVSYTVVVTNNGPDPAEDVTFIDALPAGVIVQAAPVVAGWTCNLLDGGAQVSCAKATPLAAGDTATFVYDAQLTIDSLAETALVNTVGVRTTTTESDLDNNVDTAEVQRIPIADVSLVKSVDSPTVFTNGLATYTIVVTNAGPDPAEDVVVVDNLPPGVVIEQPPLVAGWTCAANAAGDELTCSRTDPMPAGASESLTYTARVTIDAAAETDLVNTATVTTSTEDPDPTNNEDTETIQRIPIADVSIIKSVDDAAVFTNGTVTYTLAVTNDGPDPAEDVVVVDTLPAGVVIDAVPVVAGWGCSASAAGDVLTCERAGAMPAGASETLSYTATVTIDADPETDLVNTATVTTSTEDPDPTNNEDTETIQRIPIADVSIVKNVDLASVATDGTVTYTLDIANAGPDPAEDVLIVDQLPAGVVVADLPVSDDYSCSSPSPDLVICTRTSPLAAGATEMLSYTAVVTVESPALTDLVNTVTITTSTEDPNPNNNTDTGVTEREPLSDIAIDKSVANPVVFTNELAAYTIVVTNNGPDAADDVVVADQLPDGVVVNEVPVADGWTCVASDAGDMITCQLDGLLAVNAPQTLTYTATVTTDAAFDEDLVNTATVTSSSEDPDISNNSDTETIEREPSADLRVEKSVNTETVVLAFGPVDVEYAILVTNDGPDTAENLSVVDTVPDGLTVDTAPVLDGWTCAVDGQVITCTVDSLVAGGSAELTYTATVELSARLGALVNVVDVGSDTNDPDITNNRDEEKVVRSPGITTRPILDPVDPLPDPTPVPDPDPVPAAVPPLAITGSSSPLLVTLATAMMAIGGIFFVGARRRRDED